MKCKSCDEMSLPKIERNSCGENFGQAQILAFVDLADSEVIAALTETGVKTKATWTAKMAGEQPGVSISPMLYNPNTNPGGENTWGGGNATPDGKTYTLGKDPSEFTAELRKATAAQQDGMEALTCLAEADRLGVYIFDGDGQVMGMKDGESFKPIKVMKLFVSDVTLMGSEEPDYNSLSMQLEAGWSGKRKVVELTDFRGADLIGATIA